jgi:hypothetical protein
VVAVSLGCLAAAARRRRLGASDDCEDFVAIGAIVAGRIRRSITHTG